MAMARTSHAVRPVLLAALVVVAFLFVAADAVNLRTRLQRTTARAHEDTQQQQAETTVETSAEATAPAEVDTVLKPAESSEGTGGHEGSKHHEQDGYVVPTEPLPVRNRFPLELVFFTSPTCEACRHALDTLQDALNFFHGQNLDLKVVNLDEHPQWLPADRIVLPGTVISYAYGAEVGRASNQITDDPVTSGDQYKTMLRDGLFYMAATPPPPAFLLAHGLPPPGWRPRTVQSINDRERPVAENSEESSEQTKKEQMQWVSSAMIRADSGLQRSRYLNMLPALVPMQFVKRVSAVDLPHLRKAFGYGPLGAARIDTTEPGFEKRGEYSEESSGSGVDEWTAEFPLLSSTIATAHEGAAESGVAEGTAPTAEDAGTAAAESAAASN